MVYEEIVKMLGVELNERFRIRPYYTDIEDKYRGYVFRFINHPNRLCYKSVLAKDDIYNWSSLESDEIIGQLVKGSYVIFKE